MTCSAAHLLGGLKRSFRSRLVPVARENASLQARHPPRGLPTPPQYASPPPQARSANAAGPASGPSENPQPFRTLLFLYAVDERKPRVHHFSSRAVTSFSLPN